MAASGASSVDLDMRDVDPALFPNVVSALRQAGIDPERELIPVAPAAHYMMGGIATDVHGRATLAGLHAVGECSCTGLHGANRLASNSLTECFVFGARAARSAVAQPIPDTAAVESAAESGGPTPGRTKPPPISAASREALWRHAGLERDAAGLRELTADPHPLVRLIAECALARTESRGAHQRSRLPRARPGVRWPPRDNRRSGRSGPAKLDVRATATGRASWPRTPPKLKTPSFELTST